VSEKLFKIFLSHLFFLTRNKTVF